MTLAEVLEAEAEELGVVAKVGTGGGVEWHRGARVFATLSGATAEFRLAGAIAEAALRTPDTVPSPRGRDWVSFTPAELDEMAVDRAAAWFASAWRHAAD
jgi:hypothetical protein